MAFVIGCFIIGIMLFAVGQELNEIKYILKDIKEALQKGNEK